MKSFELCLLREGKWQRVDTLPAASRRQASAKLRGYPKKEDKITSIEINGETTPHGCWRLSPL